MTRVQLTLEMTRLAMGFWVPPADHIDINHVRSCDMGCVCDMITQVIKRFWDETNHLPDSFKEAIREK